MTMWSPPPSVVFFAALLILLMGASLCGAQTLPWQIWTDLHSVAELHEGDQVLLRSSHCPDGCPYDRHSDGDWRYLRLEGEEGVIFEEAGAGAITRIWMTQGSGSSEPLSASIRIRIYLDGESTPAVDIPLPALFDGSTPPFDPPLVGDRLVSSGGNFSYVPIAYRDGCKITMTGAHEERIWFQFSFHRLASAVGVTSYTGDEDLNSWATLLASHGEDPWALLEQIASSSTSRTGMTTLNPGETQQLCDLAGPDSITAMRLNLPVWAWPEVNISLYFDDRNTVSMSLAEFFAVGRGGLTSTQSLFLGVDPDGSLYNYFPMPFSASMTFDLKHSGETGSSPVEIGWLVRTAGKAPSTGSGTFIAQFRQDDETEIGKDIPLLELEGKGRWVGLFADLTSVDTLSRGYLEGDERVYLDSSLHPSIYGTGAEDIFNGGFYFDQGEFLLPLHGMPYHFVADGEDTTAAYRMMVIDGATWRHEIRAGIEGGPQGDRALRVRTVAYAYSRPEPGLWPWHTLDLGDPGSRDAHAYWVDGPVAYLELDSFFQSEPPQPLQAVGAYRSAGASYFTLPRIDGARRLRLRRRLDAGVAWQAAEVWLNGEHVSDFAPLDLNEDRRWREIDIDLPPAGISGDSDNLQIMVVALPDPDAPASEHCFTAFSWQLWTDVDPTIFSDGFETGNTSGW